MSENTPIAYQVMEQLYGAPRGDWSQPARTDTPCWCGFAMATPRSTSSATPVPTSLP